MNKLYSIIKRPLVTEKSNSLRSNFNQIAFEVQFDASKTEIKKAIEKLFEVKVDKVCTSIVHGKMKRVGRHVGRQSNWKKAIVTLKEGSSIELFEGV